MGDRQCRSIGTGLVRAMWVYGLVRVMWVYGGELVDEGRVEKKMERERGMIEEKKKRKKKKRKEMNKIFKPMCTVAVKSKYLALAPPI